MFTFDQIEKNIRILGDYTLERRDPHGFWFIKKTKGTTPKELNKAFTESSFAALALQNYLKNK